MPTHNWTFGYATKQYADGYDRIFGKKADNGKEELDKEGDKASGRVQRKGKKGAQIGKRLRKSGSKKGVKSIHKNQATSRARKNIVKNEEA